MKNKKQKNQTNAGQELRRLGALIEHVDGSVGLIAEQQGDIKKILDSHTEILDSHTEMIGELKVDLEIVKGDVKTTKDDLEIVKKDVKTTKIDLEIIKTDIEFIKNSIKKKIDVDEFSALERRVALLERRR